MSGIGKIFGLLSLKETQALSADVSGWTVRITGMLGDDTLAADEHCSTTLANA